MTRACVATFILVAIYAPARLEVHRVQIRRGGGGAGTERAEAVSKPLFEMSDVLRRLAVLLAPLLSGPIAEILRRLHDATL
jgi:hypothetical protein